MITDILIACIGWIVGIVVNYLADVLPHRRRLVTPFCLACDQTQSWLQYAIWPRRCVSCGYRRLWRVWVVEVFYIIIAIWLWKMPVENINFLAGISLLVYFGVVVIIDIEHRLIMHPVSIVGAVLAFLIGISINGIVKTIIGGIAGFVSMWLLYKLGELIIKMIAKFKGQIVTEVALGFGDVNLSGVLGLLLGWPSIWVGLFLAILLAGAVSLVYMILMLILRKYQLFSTLPYGPFLVAGAVLILFFRESLIKLFGG